MKNIFFMWITTTASTTLIVFSKLSAFNGIPLFLYSVFLFQAHDYEQAGEPFESNKSTKVPNTYSISFFFRIARLWRRWHTSFWCQTMTKGQTLTHRRRQTYTHTHAYMTGFFQCPYTETPARLWLVGNDNGKYLPNLLLSGTELIWLAKNYVIAKKTSDW